MFEPESLPDLIIHTQLRLETTEPLPAHARRIAVIDLAGLVFYERGDLPALFSLILSATIEPVEHLVVRIVDHRARTEDEFPDDLAVRYDLQRYLHLEIENTSGAALEWSGALLTIAGIPAAPTPADYASTPAPPLSSAPCEVRAVSLTGVVLGQEWVSITPLSGAIEHNSLGAIQGGTPDERYHLTLAQLGRVPSAAVTAALVGDGAPSADNKFITENDLESALEVEANAREDADELRVLKRNPPGTRILGDTGFPEPGEPHTTDGFYLTQNPHFDFSTNPNSTSGNLPEAPGVENQVDVVELVKTDSNHPEPDGGFGISFIGMAGLRKVGMFMRGNRILRLFRGIVFGDGTAFLDDEGNAMDAIPVLSLWNSGAFGVNMPGLRYNITSSKWQFRNSGTTWSDFGSGAPSGTAGGDLGGSFPNPAVNGIRGVGISATAPTTGQVLKATSPTAAEWATLTTGSGDLLAALVSNPVAVTAGVTLTTGAFGKLHVCSGTTSNYTVTLPAASGNAGKIIGFRMAAGLSKLVTIDGNGSETIDGAASRVMWAQETAILLCDGVSWSKIAGRNRPMAARGRRASALFIPNNTVISVPLTVPDFDNSGAMVNVASGSLNIVRSGLYNVTGSLTYDNVPASPNAQVKLCLNGNTIGFGVGVSSYNANGWYPAPQASTPINVSAGDYLELKTFFNGADSNLYLDIGSNWISAVEVPDW